MDEDKYRAEYLMPKQCEACGSENLKIVVIYDKTIARYECLDCGNSRSIAKVSNLKRRTSTPLTHWAVQVIKRHPACTICGSKDRLEAHHIIPVSHSERFKLVASNGITLCKNCHWLVHNKEGER